MQQDLVGDESIGADPAFQLGEVLVRQDRQQLDRDVEAGDEAARTFALQCLLGG
jgi:hypothetical protein